MWLFQDFLDQSKQLNQAPSRSLPAYHPPNKKYKIIWRTGAARNQ